MLENLFSLVTKNRSARWTCHFKNFDLKGTKNFILIYKYYLQIYKNGPLVQIFSNLELFTSKSAGGSNNRGLFHMCLKRNLFRIQPEKSQETNNFTRVTFLKKTFQDESKKCSNFRLCRYYM